MGLNPELGTALGALQLVPGLQAFASVGQLAVGLFGDAPEPRVSLPKPFIPGSFLWGVPRQQWLVTPPLGPAIDRPRNEVGFIASWTESPSAGAPHDQGRPSAMVSRWFPGALGDSSDPMFASTRRTEQEPPYDIDLPHTTTGLNFHTYFDLTVPDLIWAEALRRGSPMHLEGASLFFKQGFSEMTRRVFISSIQMLDGEWDPWTDLDGAPVSDQVEVWLASANDRLYSQDRPVFDDLDLRTWEDGVWLDAWQEDVCNRGVAYYNATIKEQYRSGTVHPFAIEAKELAQERLSAATAEYELRRATWEAWRAQLQATREMEQAFADQQAAWDEAWTAAIESGATIDEAGAIASGVFAAEQDGSGLSLSDAIPPPAPFAPLPQPVGGSAATTSPAKVAVFAGFAGLLVALL